MRRKKIDKDRLKRMTPEEYAEYGKMKDLERMSEDEYNELSEQGSHIDRYDTQRNNSQIINNKR